MPSRHRTFIKYDLCLTPRCGLKTSRRRLANEFSKSDAVSQNLKFPNKFAETGAPTPEAHPNFYSWFIF
jgi:hypothetical protein